MEKEWKLCVECGKSKRNITDNFRLRKDGALDDVCKDCRVKFGGGEDAAPPSSTRMKTCNECGEEKERTEANFGRAAQSKDGFNWKCKACIAAISRKKYAEKHGGATPAPKQRRTPRAPKADPPAKTPEQPGGLRDQLTDDMPEGPMQKLAKEITDVAAIVENGKVLLRQKLQALLEMSREDKATEDTE